MVDGIPCREHQPVPTSDTIVVSVLPEALHQQALSMYHDSPAIGHQGTAGKGTTGGVLGEHGPMYHMTEVQLPMLERTLLLIFNITFIHSDHYQPRSEIDYSFQSNIKTSFIIMPKTHLSNHHHSILKFRSLHHKLYEYTCSVCTLFTNTISINLHNFLLSFQA